MNSAISIAIIRRVWLMHLLLCFVTSSSLVHAQSPQEAKGGQRERLNFDSGWKFALGHATDPQKDFGYATLAFDLGKAGSADGPAAPKFDDRTWRGIDLPHDWAVELPFNQKGDGNHGSKAIGRNFSENSVGWYRKTFTIPKEDEGRRIGIDFDGVYRDSLVWINGFYLGNEHSGYSSFHYDLTDYLNYGGENTIAVRADATREEGWFYEGAGIYRHVWLTKTSPIHVAHDGTFITTTVADPASAHPEARITAQITTQNDADTPSTFLLRAWVQDFEGHKLQDLGPINDLSADASGNVAHSFQATLPDAKLWSLENPYLYKLVVEIQSRGKVVDRYETPFGIRTIRFDPDHGFFLNEKHVELQGTNNHQDHAGVGVALPDTLNEFRIAQLKAMGSNAIRTSHNPPTPELLDICDRLGMLVLDENRMMGTTPEDLDQLKRMIVRDRNHPSVILWSVGNEEWALEWSVFGERLTRNTQAFVKRLDPTRLSTVALSGSGGGNSLTTEVFGFNYYVQHHIDEMHARFPTRPVVGTEESSSEHTRGIYFDDPVHQHLVAYDFEADGKHASVEEAWQYHLARPFSAGLFYWTGFDYRGETTPFDWPAISSQFGMLDTCGFFKDNAYLLQSWWTQKPMVHLLPHWSWPGRENQLIGVRAYSNAAFVELTLNGKSLGRKPMPKNAHLEWRVPYQPGTLSAAAYNAEGQEVARDTVETTTPPAAVQLTASTSTIAADNQAVSVVSVRIADAIGRTVPDAANLVSFQLTGPGKIIGVGNGDPASHEPDKYLQTVTALQVTGWRTKAADAIPSGTNAPPEAASTFDDSAWDHARDPRWDEHRIDPPASVYRSVFVLPAAASTPGSITLALRSMGDAQSVWLNGHALATNLTLPPAGRDFPLDASLVQPGINVVTVFATRFSNSKFQLFQWSGPGPAAVKVVSQPPQWKRSAFNGLAQVIVQSTGTPGQITLTASSPGLASSSLTIATQTNTPPAPAP